MEIINLECPSCGRPLSTEIKECPACHRPILITSFNDLNKLDNLDVKKYIKSYDNVIKSNPSNDVRFASALCLTKLKLYDKAMTLFEDCLLENIDNPEVYFYAAICTLQGRKAFLLQRHEINQIEKYLNAACDIESKGVYYLLLAYIKYDYFERKYLNTTPNYKDYLHKAKEFNCSFLDSEFLFSLLNVEIPTQLEL